MTTADPFAHFDGAYVLGALSQPDRAAFEAHLPGCAQCQARVREAEGVAGLLAGLSADVLEPMDDVPDTLLPGLLRRARAEQRRRRALTSGLVAVAAACVVALAVLLWPSASPSRPAPVAMTALVASPVTATARLTDRAWGTEIDLACTYRGSGLHEGWSYRLVVVDKRGRSQEIGTWALAPGKTIHYTSGTSLARDDIASIAINGPSDVPILRLTL